MVPDEFPVGSFDLFERGGWRKAQHSVIIHKYLPIRFQWQQNPFQNLLEFLKIIITTNPHLIYLPNYRIHSHHLRPLNQSYSFVQSYKTLPIKILGNSCLTRNALEIYLPSPNIQMSEFRLFIHLLPDQLQAYVHRFQYIPTRQDCYLLHKNSSPQFGLKLRDVQPELQVIKADLIEVKRLNAKNKWKKIAQLPPLTDSIHLNPAALDSVVDSLEIVSHTLATLGLKKLEPLLHDLQQNHKLYKPIIVQKQQLKNSNLLMNEEQCLLRIGQQYYFSLCFEDCSKQMLQSAALKRAKELKLDPDVILKNKPHPQVFVGSYPEFLIQFAQ